MIYSDSITGIDGMVYYIDIYTNDNNNEVRGLDFSSNSPIIVTMEGDEQNMFKPVKYTSATIKLVTNSFFNGFVANKITDVKVHIYNDDRTVFEGYVLPESYNQNYADKYEEYVLNCIDVVSAMQYFKYNKIANGGLVSFIDILKTIFFNKCGIQDLYIDRNIGQISVGHYELEIDLIENLFISEANFFNEDGEAWTYKEVLEEILLYVCCTAIIDGNKVYIVHYPNIKKDNRIDYKHYLSFADSGDVETESIHVTFNNKTRNVTDSSISITPSYNFIKLLCDNYPVNFDETNFLNDDTTNVTDTAYTTLRDGRILPFTAYLYKNNSSFKNPDDKYKEYWVLNSFLKNNKVEMYGYDPDEGDSIDQSKYPTNNNEYGRYVGCCLVKSLTKEAHKDLTKKQEDLDYPEINTTDGNYYLWSNGQVSTSTTKREDIKENEIPSSATVVGTIKSHEYIADLDYNFTPSGNTKLVFSLIPYQNPDPMIQFEYPSESTEFLHYQSENYINVNRNFFVAFKFSGALYISRPGQKADVSTVDDRDRFSWSGVSNNYYRDIVLEDYQAHLPSDMYLNALLRIGNYYWDGSFWTDEYSTFTLPVKENPDSLGKFTNVYNGRFTDNVEENTYVIKCNLDGENIVSGDVEFMLFYPRKLIQYDAPTYSNGTTHYHDINKLVFDEFNFKVCNGSKQISLDKSDKDDTEYTVVINDDNINEYPELSLKVCTWDNLAINHSAVYCGVINDDIYFVDKVWFDINNTVRFEERLLQNYYHQLKTPTLIYNLTADGTFNHTYRYSNNLIKSDFNVDDLIINGSTFDLLNNTTTLSLMEIKEFGKLDITKENIDRQYYRTGLIYKANPS